MDKEMIIKIAEKLVETLKLIDSAIFPANPIRDIPIAESEVDQMLVYVPSRQLALASGIPEALNSQEEKEMYVVYLNALESQFESMMQSYDRVFQRIRPGVDLIILTFAVIGGVVSHEVRHRVQFHFQPYLVTESDPGKNILTAKSIFKEKQQPLFPSQKLNAMEFDATFMEVCVVNEFLRTGRRLSSPFISRLLKRGLNQ